jgi:hypothetical protein
MSKDEIRKKKSITQKDLRKIRVKKTLIRGLQIFNWKVKLNWKITLIKEKINQKNEGQIEKKNNKKFDWIMKLKAKKTSTKVPRKKNRKWGPKWKTYEK